MRILPSFTRGSDALDGHLRVPLANHDDGPCGKEDVFGVRAIGAIMGVLTLGWRSGAALGPAAAGFLYDVSGSYAVPFGAAPGVVLVSWALFAVATSRRARA